MSAVTPPALTALWDPEGRRVPGGALAPDPPALEGEDALGFSDFLSIINPLQHIPVISTLYRWMTGDTIKPAARVIGGGLFGGPIGLVTAGFNAIFEQAAGKDVGDKVLALFQPDRSATDHQVAQEQPENSPPATPPAVAGPKPGAVRPLAFYQANAGLRLSPSETARERPVPSPAEMVRPVTHPPSLAKAASAPAEDSPSDWFAASMLRGLDQYRAMQRLQQPSPQIDLSH
jgi:hypothetical protein